LFTVVYSLLALIGGVAGCIFSSRWGGFKSRLGSAIAFLSIGLLLQFLGQILYNYYILILETEIPYPSAGDISYLASVVFYIIGTYKLTNVSGIRLTLKSSLGKFKAAFIPLAVLILSYLFLLKDYEVDLSNKIILFLDFGFPIGQVIYVSIALMALLISKDILAGMMRNPIMFLIFALIFQYIADFSFSYMYSTSPDSMYTGDVLDLLYCISYFLMAVSLISIGDAYNKVQQS
jgi:hypothetical protein